MIDCQSEEKFCYLKNKLIYPNKSSKIIFLYFSFSKNEEISFFLLQNVLCQKSLQDNLFLGIKLNKAPTERTLLSSFLL